MLPKKRKIRRLLFSLILLKNRSFKSENLMLLVNRTNKKDKTKFSVVVSKKVARKASDRNLIKRKGFNVIKNEIANIKNGFLCVLFFKKDVRGISYNEIKSEILSLFKKADILVKHI